MARNQNQEPQYEDRKPILKRNLDIFESFYFASIMKSGEYGKEGLVDGLFGALYGLREKIGLEGILAGLEVEGLEGVSRLAGLEAEGLQSIARGDGLNATYNLSNVITQNSRVYLESMVNLKVKDIILYIKDRLGIKNGNNNENNDKERTNVEIIEEEDYKDKLIKELMDKDASDKEKNYGKYLIEQVENAVMAKMVPLVYRERARRKTEGYRVRREVGRYQDIETDED